MSSGPKKTKIVTVSLNLETLAQLRCVAEEDKRSFSWVVREAVALGLPELV